MGELWGVYCEYSRENHEIWRVYTYCTLFLPMTSWTALWRHHGLPYDVIMDCPMTSSWTALWRHHGLPHDAIVVPMTAFSSACCHCIAVVSCVGLVWPHTRCDLAPNKANKSSKYMPAFVMNQPLYHLDDPVVVHWTVLHWTVPGPFEHLWQEYVSPI